MKKIKVKKILLWTLVALIIQNLGFLYIEKIYLGDSNGIKAEEVKDESNEKEKLEIKVKDDAKDIKISSSGKFLSYFSDNKLKVLDINNNEEKEVKGEDSGESIYYKWLTNEDSIIIIEKIKEKGIEYFKPVSFNAKKGELRELADFNLKDLRIKLENSLDKIDDIAFSNSTHSLYIKVKKKSGKSDLYYINVMNEMEKKRSNKLIGSIVVPNTSTKLVMELDNKPTILDSKGNIVIPNVKVSKLLGSDINDNIYLGEEVNGKIKKIHYNILSDANSKWKEYKLNNLVSKENIFIEYLGKIYINDKDKKEVIELTTNKTIKYKGEFIQGYSKGFISKDGNKIIKNLVS